MIPETARSSLRSKAYTIRGTRASTFGAVVNEGTAPQVRRPPKHWNTSLTVLTLHDDEQRAAGAAGSCTTEDIKQIVDGRLPTAASPCYVTMSNPARMRRAYALQGHATPSD